MGEGGGGGVGRLLKNKVKKNDPIRNACETRLLLKI